MNVEEVGRAEVAARRAEHREVVELRDDVGAAGRRRCRGGAGAALGRAPGAAGFSPWPNAMAANTGSAAASIRGAGRHDVEASRRRRTRRRREAHRVVAGLVAQLGRQREVARRHARRQRRPATPIDELVLEDRERLLQRLPASGRSRADRRSRRPSRRPAASMVSTVGMSVGSRGLFDWRVQALGQRHLEREAHGSPGGRGRRSTSGVTSALARRAARCGTPTRRARARASSVSA